MGLFDILLLAFVITTICYNRIFSMKQDNDILLWHIGKNIVRSKEI